MVGTARHDRPELWVETLARLSGATRLADEFLGSPRLGPYLFVFVVTVLDLYGLSFLGALETGQLRFVADPATNIVVPALLLVTFTVVRLRDGSVDVITDLPDRDEDVERILADDACDPELSGIYYEVDRFAADLGILPDLDPDGTVRVVPSRLKAAVYLLGLAMHASWLLGDPPGYQALVDLIGPTLSLVKVLGTQPFFYYLIAAELVSLLIGVHVLLPLAVSVDRRIDFTDLKDFGGLRPVGILLKTSAVHLLFLLTMYLVFIAFAIGPSLGDALPLTVIVGGSAVALVLFFAPSFWLHVHMRRMREAKIAAIGREFESVGVDDGLPPNAPAPEEDVDEYMRRFIKLSRVKDTREYPLDVAIVEEFLIVLVLPIVAHVLSTIIFENVHF